MDLLIEGALKLGIELTERQLNQFEIFYNELITWNKRFNLTRITDYKEVQIKHYLDSLTIADVWKPHDDSIIDIGSGAGIPGLPLKLVYPDIKLSLLEATRKKTEFLKHIVSLLAIKNVEIICGRAEEIAQSSKFRERFDVVIARGVGELPALVELTLPFCRIGGKFISSKKGDVEEEIVKAKKAIGLLGGKIKENKIVELSEFSDGRHLVVIEKIGNTPTKYPRRPGIPRKRPIK